MIKTMGFIGFIFGVAVGVAASRAYFKDKYEKEKQEEIDSIKEVFAKRKSRERKQVSDAREKADAAKSKPDVKNYANLLRGKRYDTVQTTGYVSVEKTVPIDGEDGPCVIPPDEFGDIEEYDTISLTYYSDKVLTDSDDRPMSESDITLHIGDEALTSFGEYEDDSVFVRNDKLKCYYEILIDNDPYSEIAKRIPREVT